MNFTKKILTGIVLLTIHTMNSQTTTTYITSGIQQHLLNKFWSTKLDDSNKVVMNFTQNQIHVYSNGKKLASDEYYMSTTSCSDLSNVFDISKVGTLSEGNYIKNLRSCYVIEFYEGFQKFRIKRTYENKWLTFYLLNNPSLQN